jgi:AraC-like DNA-binding protein
MQKQSANECNASSIDEVNLAQLPDTIIRASIVIPTGGGWHDPHVLLNETAHQLDGRMLSDFNFLNTFDTYDGQNTTTCSDWYALTFTEPHLFNCIDMTMGIPYADGGWWQSLSVEVDVAGEWQAVKELVVFPDYSFADSPVNRLPYETYTLTFKEVTTHAVRLIGMPGGTAQFTSLARIAVYHRDLTRTSIKTLPPPIPYVFKLLSPQVMWDLSSHLVKLTGIAIDFSAMQYYLDPERAEQHFVAVASNYRGQPDLWFLIGDTIGWRKWNASNLSLQGTEPQVMHLLNGTLARAVAPVIAADRVQGQIETHYVVIRDTFDEAWHRDFARQHGISWDAYMDALERSPHMTLEQLNAVAGLMGIIANTIANLMQRNFELQKELDTMRQASSTRLQQEQIVQKAITYMREHIETPLTIVDVARTVALSVPYFCTLFHKHTGQTPGEYVSALRLARAKEYLVHSQMSIMDICVALDYSPSYFSRLFRRTTGLSPSEYREKMSATPVKSSLKPR